VSSRPAQRGPYAKGVARRQEVLEVALDVLATNGLRHSTLQEIAERVGLTRPGLLHYFGTREDLLVAVLQARHERDVAQASRPGLGGSLADHIVRGVLAQHETPGLVRLDAAMAAEATDPTHPAQLYFRGRSRAVEGRYVRAIDYEIEAGRVDPDVDSAVVAQSINSLIDGLHVRWLIDPSVDVGAVLRDALSRLLPAAPRQSAR
jgi:AcrR family transcriptional regulator